MASNSTSVDTTTLPDTTTPLPPTTTPTTTPTTDPATTTPLPPTTTPTTTIPTTTPPTTTSTSTAPTAPPSTQIITSVVSVAPSNGVTQAPSTVIVTQISTPTDIPSTTSSRGDGTAAGASNSATAGASSGGGGGGLSSGGKIAIAVVIPIVAVAGLLFLFLFLLKRRKQRKTDEDERRKEMEAYGFNPNNDPTLPVVGAMTESDDQSGYRGWGGGTAAGTMSNRKASTTLSSANGNPAAYSPGSPNAGTDASGEPILAGVGAASAAAVAGAQMSHSRNTTMDSDTMGAGYGAAGMHLNKAGVQRGPSNASSTYSMGGASHHSAEAPIPVNSNEQYYTDYYQSGPYDNSYANEAVIRDNPARRNTRIERAPTFPNQGSSGVATNF